MYGPDEVELKTMYGLAANASRYVNNSDWTLVSFSGKRNEVMHNYGMEYDLTYTVKLRKN